MPANSHTNYRRISSTDCVCVLALLGSCSVSEHLELPTKQPNANSKKPLLFKNLNWRFSIQPNIQWCSLNQSWERLPIGFRWSIAVRWLYNAPPVRPYSNEWVICSISFIDIELRRIRNFTTVVELFYSRRCTLACPAVDTNSQTRQLEVRLFKRAAQVVQPNPDELDSRSSSMRNPQQISPSDRSNESIWTPHFGGSKEARCHHWDRNDWKLQIGVLKVLFAQCTGNERSPFKLSKWDRHQSCRW